MSFLHTAGKSFKFLTGGAAYIKPTLLRTLYSSPPSLSARFPQTEDVQCVHAASFAVRVRCPHDLCLCGEMVGFDAEGEGASSSDLHVLLQLLQAGAAYEECGAGFGGWVDQSQVALFS